MRTLLMPIALTMLLAGSFAAARAETVLSGIERNVDMEVLTLGFGPDHKPYAVVRQFLEARKRQLNPALAQRSQVRLREVGGNVSALVGEFQDDGTLPWAGAALPIEGGIQFALRIGSEPAQLFRYRRGQEHAVRVELPWLRSTASVDAEGYSRIYPVGDVIVGVRAQREGEVAHAWVPGQAEAVALGVDAIGPDARAATVHDIGQTQGPGGAGMVMLVTGGRVGSTSPTEAWLLFFSALPASKSVAAVRLDTGPIAGADGWLLRNGAIVTGAALVTRSQTTSPATLKTFDLSRGTPLASRDMRRLTAQKEIAAAAACGQRQVIVDWQTRERGTPAKGQIDLIEPSGQRAASREIVPAEPGSIAAVGAAASPQRLLSWVNFTRLEETRRADGWYSWRGYRIDNHADVDARCR